MKIIPAIDLMDGKCVRLTQGSFATQKTYSDDPLSIARQFEDAGIQYLHLVDLDGAKSGKTVNTGILEQIACKTSLQVDFGGGIKTAEDLETALSCGAMQVNIGTIAVQQPELFASWLNRYGPDKIILSADCRDRLVSAAGWMEDSTEDIIPFISRYKLQGLQYVTCTDISRDGMLSGPSVSLYREIINTCNISLTASGGISSVADLYALKALGCTGVIVGKAIYEGRITLKELAALC